MINLKRRDMSLIFGDLLWDWAVLGGILHEVGVWWVARVHAVGKLVRNATRIRAHTDNPEARATNSVVGPICQESLLDPGYNGGAVRTRAGSSMLSK